MNFMISISGEPEQIPYLPEINTLGAGIELGGYGLIGVKSEQDWDTRFAFHKEIRAKFSGALAIHGPFVGMEYTHLDYQIRDVVSRRMDMTFEVAVKLQAGRVTLHGGYKPENDLFNLQDGWFNSSVEYWQREIQRWAKAGIEIVLENVIEKSPDLLVRLVNKIDNPFLGLCLDIGHQNMFSKLDAVEWVRRMDNKLFHIHLHDNDGTQDRHWSLGRGSIDFQPFYAALLERAPQATISLEVEDRMDVKMNDLRKLFAHFR